MRVRPRRQNQRSWLYRIRPSVTHEPFHPLDFPQETLTANFSQASAPPSLASCTLTMPVLDRSTSQSLAPQPHRSHGAQELHRNVGSPQAAP